MLFPLVLGGIGEGAVETFTLPAAVTGGAVSGAGAVALLDKEAVRFYKDLSAPTGRGAADATQKMAGMPTGVAWKPVGDKGYFLVLCDADHTLHVFDDRTFTQVKVIALASGGCTDVAASLNPADHRAYVVTGPRQDFSGGRVSRIDLDTMAVDGPLAGSREVSEGIDEIEVSGDGTYLFATRPSVSPSGVRVFRLPPLGSRSLDVATVVNRHEDARGYMPDAAGLLVGCGTQLYTPDWTPVATADSIIGAFFQDRPVCVGYTAQELVFYAADPFRRVGAVAHQLEPLEPGQQSRIGRVRAAGGAEPTILADGARGAVYAFFEKRGTVVRTADVAVPAAPYLGVRVASTTSFETDVPGQVRLEKLWPGAAVTLASGPAGLRVAGDALDWTPSARDVGEAKVVLKVAGGGRERTQSLTIDVRRPSLALGFVPQDMAVSPDGRRAVLMRSRRPEEVQPGRDERVGTRMVVVDLEKNQVLADRTLDVPVQTLAMDGQFVYAGASPSPMFYALRVADLTEARRVFVPQPVTRLVPMGTRLLVNTMAFSLPGLMPVSETPDAWNVPQTMGGNDSRLGVAYPSGALYQGVLYDRNTGKPRLLLGTPVPNIQTMGDGPQGSTQPLQGWGVNPEVLNRPAAAGAVRTMNGSALLVDIPALATVAVLPSRQSTGPDGAVSYDAKLKIVDLVSFKEVDALTLVHGQGYAFENSLSPPLIVRGAAGRVLVTLHDRLYLVPTSLLPREQLTVPLAFEPEQSLFVLEAGKVHRLTYKVRGASGPLTFSLKSAAEGMEVTPRTGEVAIDGTRIVKKAAEAAVERMRGNGMLDAVSLRGSPEELVGRFAKPQLEATKVFALAENVVPMCLTVNLAAVDGEGQTATLVHYVLVAVPRASVVQALADWRRADDAQQRRGAEAARQAVQAAEARQAAAAGRGAVPAGDLQRRVVELERQVQDLEAQNRLLKELLTRQPSTRR
jgi:hypothetical protein